jgi:quinol monooxygenase YgiN
MAADQVSWMVHLSVRPHRLELFKSLTREMVDATRQERGVLSYERFISDDGSTIHVYERYEVSAAAIDHLLEFRRRFSERFSTMIDRIQFVVYGNPTKELREIFDSFQPIYFQPFGDFDYWA